MSPTHSPFSTSQLLNFSTSPLPLPLKTLNTKGLCDFQQKPFMFSTGVSRVSRCFVHDLEVEQKQNKQKDAQNDHGN
jgi:hypothetical protein